MVNKFFRSQNGFAIVQGLMLAAAVAGLAYVGTKMITDQKMAEKGVESKSKLEQLHASIYSILQNKDHCTQTLNSAGVVTSVVRVTPRSGVGQARAMSITAQPVQTILTAGSVNPIFTTQDYNPSAGVIAYMGNSVTIKSMAVDCEDQWCSLVDLKVTYGKLDKQADGKTGSGFGGKQITKTIKLQIQTNSANGFLSCYAVNVGENETLVKDFCNELGADTNATTAGDTLFTWDETYNRCVIKDLKCPSGRVFAGWDSNGGRRCNEIKDWMNLGNVLDTSPVLCPKNSTSVKFVILASGKAQIQCSGASATCTTSCNCPGNSDYCRSGTCSTTQPIVGNTCTASENCVQVGHNVFLACSGGYWVQVNGTNPGCTWPKSMTPC